MRALGWRTDKYTADDLEHVTGAIGGMALAAAGVENEGTLSMITDGP
ncbi:hypothetical protein AB0F17_59475 [Nonomuraea sp. NPDC026600]